MCLGMEGQRSGVDWEGVLKWEVGWCMCWASKGIGLGVFVYFGVDLDLLDYIKGGPFDL